MGLAGVQARLSEPTASSSRPRAERGGGGGGGGEWGAYHQLEPRKWTQKIPASVIYKFKFQKLIIFNKVFRKGSLDVFFPHSGVVLAPLKRVRVTLEMSKYTYIFIYI